MSSVLPARLSSLGGWLAVGLIGAGSLGWLVRSGGEPVSALWLIVATFCVAALSYRFYSAWLFAEVLTLDERRAPPACVHEDGADYVKTNSWIVFGHHFAAIAGPGPLVGPVLAAQFGYLPGALWILIGATLAGGVHDAVILFCSTRRDGHSLGQMVREEIGPFAGLVATIGILAILVILIAVLGLVVVKALAESPWGLFTIAMTIPISMAMGGSLRYLCPGRVGLVSFFGVVGLLASVYGGQFLPRWPGLESLFTFDGPSLAWSIIIYGLAASTLPVWLLLAPRDYLSTFMKIGTVAALGGAVILLGPKLQMPAVTKFIDGTGPVFAGTLFPFCFITIACGAISGFHALVSSGTTPKLITRESCIRSIGYGAMLTEMIVAIMALTAACSMDPGVYFAINIKGEPAAVVQQVTAAGFPVTEAGMRQLAADLGEKNMIGRTGGAPTFAVGMASMFAGALGTKDALPLWYHFAIMFEALFILTTIDAGTRIGRFIVQDLFDLFLPPLGHRGGLPANVIASTLFVAAWGWFLYQGVVDPMGGINSLWPIFGIANQLLAVIALALGTTVIIKGKKPVHGLVTFLPLVWLFIVTMSSGWLKIMSADPRIGFLAQVAQLREKAAVAGLPGPEVSRLNTLIFNNQVDAVVTGIFLILVLTIIAACAREWYLLLSGRKTAMIVESPYVELEGSPA